MLQNHPSKTSPLLRVGRLSLLPGLLFLLVFGALAPLSARADVALYRVNVGGEAQTALDLGIPWDVDTNASPSPYHIQDSIPDAYPGGALDPSVPATTPPEVFDTQRYDDPFDPSQMSWDFPVGAGRAVEVRLYFKNGYPGTSLPGQRVFNVQIDGVPVLTNYDIVADVGHNVGVMKSFFVVGDGNLDIDFLSVVNNPLVSAIEIRGEHVVNDRFARQIAGTLDVHWELLSGAPGDPIGCTDIEFTDGDPADAADGTVTMVGQGLAVGGGSCVSLHSFNLTMSPDGLSLTGTVGSVPVTLVREPSDAAFVGEWAYPGYVYRLHVAADPFPIPDYAPSSLGEWIGWWQQDDNPDISGAVTLTIDQQVLDAGSGGWLVQGAFDWKGHFGGELSGHETFDATLSPSGAMVIQSTGMVDPLNITMGDHQASRAADGLTITGATTYGQGPGKIWQVARVSAFAVPQEMATIQGAVDSFWDRSALRIEVAPGTHNENLDLAALAASPGVVEIVGTGAAPAETVIDDGIQGFGPSIIATNGAAAQYPVTLRNLTVTGGSATGPDAGGVWITAGSRAFVIESCEIVGNQYQFIDDPNDPNAPYSASNVHVNFYCRARVEATTVADGDWFGLLVGGRAQNFDFVRTGEIVAVDSIFRDNTTTFAGAGLAVIQGTSARLLRCDFERNSSLTSTGGALLFTISDSLFVDGCRFADNTAALRGGAIIMGNGPEHIELKNSEFVRNTALSQEGGAIWFEAGYSSDPGAIHVYRIEGCVFGGAPGDGNTAQGSGGAIYVNYPWNYYPALIQIVDSTFRGNTATYGGGVAAVSSTRFESLIMNLELTGSVLAENSAVIGGGLYISRDEVDAGQTVLEGCDFLDNTAQIYGGGLVSLNGLTPATMTDCVFDGNVLTNPAGIGAGIFLQGGSLQLTGSAFRSNGGGGYGGAVAMINAPGSVLSDCQFGGAPGTGSASSVAGGAVFIQQAVAAAKAGPLDVGGAAFGATPGRPRPQAVAGIAGIEPRPEKTAFTTEIRNCSLDDGQSRFGGAIAFVGNAVVPGELLLEDLDVSNNTVDSAGGGLFIQSDAVTTTAVSCEFRANTALGTGGAVQVNTGSTTIVNGLFYDNEATGTDSQGVSPFGGGALAVVAYPGSVAGSAQLVNCTLAANRSLGTDPLDTGGGILVAGGAVEVFNSILWDNTAVNGTAEEQHLALVANEGIAPTADLQHVTVGGIDPQVTPFGPGPINDLDPMFVDQAQGDLRLSAGSPAIDAGNVAFLPAGLTTDLDGNPRIIGVTVDLGPYEYDSVSDVDDGAAAPSATVLRGAFPNPFNPRVTVTYALDRERRAKVSVYDVQGRLIRVLEEGLFGSGTRDVVWDGTGADGVRMASGTYLVELQAGAVRDRRTVTLLK